MSAEQNQEEAYGRLLRLIVKSMEIESNFQK